MKLGSKRQNSSAFRKAFGQPLMVLAATIALIAAISLVNLLSNGNISVNSAAAPTVLAPKVMPKSLPTRLVIPAIGVDTPFLTTGQQSDGSIQMPVRYDIAAWYDQSPTPGERGPSIIVGHVDNWKGVGIFWRLKELKPGDTIAVSRTDGTTANFSVTDIKEFSKNDFPSKEVYGGINYAGIRLITCGGLFNHQTGEYSDNIVVFGKLQ
jgi:LPXTG-site transpeptidase (sortase) family protein